MKERKAMLSKEIHAANRRKQDVYSKIKRRNILLIDDDELIRDSLTQFFKSQGVHLSAFETAEKGLEEIKKENYNIIIVDYRLPGIDGIEFFKRIRETHNNTLKILITAYRDHKLVSEAEKVGVQVFVEKPFTSMTIKQALSWLIDKYGLKEEK